MASGTPDDLVAACGDAGVRDERVLEAVAAVPRAGFVPDGLVARAYIDAPLPIGRQQVTTQPSLVARMVEALALQGSERVLEVGTGYAWQTALLARLAERVYTVERFAEFTEEARARLERHGVANVELTVGDGSAGLPERAPFDAILVAAAYPGVPPPLVEQLAEGGRLVQPIGPGGAEDVTLFEKRGGALVARGSVTGAHFVRLVGRHGYSP